MYAKRPGRTRTCGQALRRRLLYPLSYGGRVCGLGRGVPGCGPVRDVAGDKDRAPGSLSLLLHLRGSMWRFSEAVLIIAGRYESCIAFGARRHGCCALVMPGLCPCPSHPFRPLCSVGAQTCSYASEFPQNWAFFTCGDLGRTASAARRTLRPARPCRRRTLPAAPGGGSTRACQSRRTARPARRLSGAPPERTRSTPAGRGRRLHRRGEVDARQLPCRAPGQRGRRAAADDPHTGARLPPGGPSLVQRHAGAARPHARVGASSGPGGRVAPPR